MTIEKLPSGSWRIVEMVDGTKMVIEIKPYNQTKKPLNENCWAAKEWSKNKCKWKAAMEFCENKGYKFKGALLCQQKKTRWAPCRSNS